jgi:hypothetical protein
MRKRSLLLAKSELRNLSNKINVISGRTEYFGNITIMLHSLGSSAYRIEWVSRMTGASTSISRLMKDKYLVMKKWSSNMNLPTASSEFNSRKSALMHFLNNVTPLRQTQKQYMTQNYAV